MPASPILPAKLIQIALREQGVSETGHTNCGPRVNEYKAATTLPAAESWPWCAAFVCWCVQEALRALGLKETPTFKRPTTASAFNLINWSRAQDNTTATKMRPGSDIRPGDIVIYEFSHTGIALSVPDKAGKFFAIEGNTDAAGSREGGMVAKKSRRTDQVRARIRFTI